MSKEMNKLLQQTLKYDLGSGILISLLIVLSSSFLSAMIYFLGIFVGLINFICSTYITEKFILGEGNSFIGMSATIFRVMSIIIIAVPLINDVKLIALYLSGFISHFIVLSISCIINRKGSV